LCDQFFASRAGAPFDDYDHRELLDELLETGTGDPLRWSATRIEQALAVIDVTVAGLQARLANGGPIRDGRRPLRSL
jgi:hypothetical protein